MSIKAALTHCLSLFAVVLHQQPCILRTPHVANLQWRLLLQNNSDISFKQEQYALKELLTTAELKQSATETDI